jgi:hypothetical protein
MEGTQVIGFIIGVFVGNFIGVALMALLAMAKDPESPKLETEQKEPTILWTKGNLCKLDGETYEIRDMVVDYQNQVIAVLRNDGGAIMAPIEELEAVE